MDILIWYYATLLNVAVKFWVTQKIGGQINKNNKDTFSKRLNLPGRI